MKEVHLSVEAKEQLTNWLMEQPAKFANPILQFLEENEVKEDKVKPVDMPPKDVYHKKT